MNSTNWPRSQVWLHSSVGRASHRYRGGHGFESRWSPDFFRLLLSNSLNWKINCDDHSSLSSTTAVHIWIISYKLHIKIEIEIKIDLLYIVTNTLSIYKQLDIIMLNLLWKNTQDITFCKVVRESTCQEEMTHLVCVILINTHENVSYCFS